MNLHFINKMHSQTNQFLKMVDKVYKIKRNPLSFLQ